MGKIIISENASLDGVVQDPTGEEGFRFGGWFAKVGDNDRQAWARLGAEEAISAKALLLGASATNGSPGVGWAARARGRID